jgi:serine/threonine protein kinase
MQLPLMLLPLMLLPLLLLPLLLLPLPLMLLLSADMAPEVIRSTKGTEYDGRQADIWSCGVMLYVMLFGRYPFDATGADPQVNAQHGVRNVINKILGMQWDIPPNIPVSPECRDLLQRLLVADPAQRLSMTQIQQHPWFLKDLPPGVVQMNEVFLSNNDFAGAASLSPMARNPSLSSGRSVQPVYSCTSCQGCHAMPCSTMRIT